MKLRAIIAILTVVLLLGSVTGCANMTRRQQRVLSGGAIGAGTGAALGAIVGHGVLGPAAIGAAAGVLGGLIVDESKRRR